MCAALDYLHRWGVPMTLEALAEQYLLSYRHPSGSCRRACRWRALQFFQSIWYLALRVAVLARFGIALMPSYLTASAFIEGSLVPLLRDVRPGLLSTERCFIWSASRQPAFKVRSFIDHVVDIST